MLFVDGFNADADWKLLSEVQNLLVNLFANSDDILARCHRNRKSEYLFTIQSDDFKGCFQRTAGDIGNVTKPNHLCGAGGADFHFLKFIDTSNGGRLRYSQSPTIKQRRSSADNLIFEKDFPCDIIDGKTQSGEPVFINFNIDRLER